MRPFGVLTIVEDFYIGDVTPFRYRGYYWCEALQMYHLQIRWYDPIIGRFISPDAYEYLDPETIGGLNLYAYCLNNPIMYTDTTGHSAILTGLIIGAGYGFYVVNHAMRNIVDIENVLDEGYNSLYPCPISLFL